VYIKFTHIIVASVHDKSRMTSKSTHYVLSLFP